MFDIHNFYSSLVRKKIANYSRNSVNNVTINFALQNYDKCIRAKINKTKILKYALTEANFPFFSNNILNDISNTCFIAQLTSMCKTVILTSLLIFTYFPDRPCVTE